MGFLHMDIFLRQWQSLYQIMSNSWKHSNSISFLICFLSFKYVARNFKGVIHGSASAHSGEMQDLKWLWDWAPKQTSMARYNFAYSENGKKTLWASWHVTNELPSLSSSSIAVYMDLDLHPSSSSDFWEETPSQRLEKKLQGLCTACQGRAILCWLDTKKTLNTQRKTRVKSVSQRKLCLNSGQSDSESLT